MNPDVIEDLDPERDDQPEMVDHPLEVSNEEAEAGLAAYKAVDDLDDEDAGMDF